jgi:hypothetical protein
MKKWLFCCLLLLSQAIDSIGYAQEPADSSCVTYGKNIEKEVDQLIIANRVESSHIGVAGIASQVYVHYEQLKKWATQSQLEQLCLHPSPSVRVYAYHALKSRFPTRAIVLKPQIPNPEASVRTLFGCTLQSMTVAQLLDTHL